MKRTFKENLEFAKEHNIVLLDLETACAVEGNICVVDFTDEEFEEMCAKVENVYLKSENLEPDDIAYCINDMLNDGATVEDILNMDVYDLLEKSSYYY